MYVNYKLCESRSVLCPRSDLRVSCWTLNSTRSLVVLRLPRSTHIVNIKDFTWRCQTANVVVLIDWLIMSRADADVAGCNKWSIDDMWRMAWQVHCCRIIMVTNLVEKGKVLSVTSGLLVIFDRSVSASYRKSWIFMLLLIMLHPSPVFHSRVQISLVSAYLVQS